MAMQKLGFKLILVFIVLAIILFFVVAQGRLGSQGTDTDLFRANGENGIVEISIAKPGRDFINLSQNDDLVWMLNDSLRANDAAVRELLAALRQLSVRMPVSTLMRDSVFAALANQGTLVRIYSRNHLISISDRWNLLPLKRNTHSFWVGGLAANDAGNYMMAEKSNIPVIVHIPGNTADLAEIFNTHMRVWRDPVVIDLPASQIASIAATFPQGDSKSYTIDFTDAQPKVFLDGQSLEDGAWDAQRLERHIKSFHELYYQKLLEPQEDSLLMGSILKPAFFELTVKDRNGNSTHLMFFRKASDTMGQTTDISGLQFDPNLFFLHINGQTWALANYFVFNRIIRQPEFFLSDRIP